MHLQKRTWLTDVNGPVYFLTGSQPHIYSLYFCTRFLEKYDVN